jgi:hypothetical protein
LGRCHYARQEWGAAKAAFIRAKDEDICPLRILQPMQEAIARVARQAGAPLVSVRRLFERASPHGIPGDDALIDHVHPRIEGHQQIALALLDEMVRQGWASQPQPGWEAERTRRFDANLDGLDPGYFPQSLERLRGLQRWTQGRVQRVRSGQPQQPVATGK